MRPGNTYRSWLRNYWRAAKKEPGVPRTPWNSVAALGAARRAGGKHAKRKGNPYA